MKIYGFLICKVVDNNINEVLKVCPSTKEFFRWTDDLGNASIFEAKSDAEGFYSQFIPMSEKNVEIKEIRII